MDRLEERTWNHYGWKVSCIEKDAPLIDIEMKDEINGFPVDDAKECFKDCQNLISIKHISTAVLDNYKKKRFPELEHSSPGAKFSTYSTGNDTIFKNSGLKKIPEQLTKLHRTREAKDMLRYAEQLEDEVKIHINNNNNQER